MTTRTATCKGLERPHKHEAAKPGIGASMSNAKSIATERSPKGLKSAGGVAHTYFGNSRSIGTERGKK
jgi:hypothetical protein